MATRSVGLGEMFGWIPAAIRMCRDGKETLLSAALWMVAVVVVMLVPLLAAMAADGAFTPRGAGAPYQPGVLFWTLEALVVVFSLAVFPALAVGWFRLCSALDAGVPTRGVDVFVAFSEPVLWGRALGVTGVAVAIAAVLFALMLLPFASTFMAFQHASQAQQAAIAAGEAVPTLDFPWLMFLAYFAWILLVVIVQMVAGLAFGEVAARATGPVAAMRLAAAAIARNFFKLVLFWFCLSALVGAVAMVLIIPVILKELLRGLNLISELLQK